MLKRFSVLAVFFFSALASFAEAPSLWFVDYSSPEKLSSNALTADKWMRKVDRVRPNASALASREVAFSIEGISHTFVREYQTEGLVGTSVFGRVGNSPFLSVITTDKGGRVVVDSWIEQGGRAKNFQVIGNTLFEVDNGAIAQKLRDDYRPEFRSGSRRHVESLSKRRSVRVCGDPYRLDTTAYFYDEDAVNHSLFEGDEAALRVYLQNAAESINAALRNSKVNDVVVRLVKLEKIPNFSNELDTFDLLSAFGTSDFSRNAIESGVNSTALWFGTYRGDNTLGVAGYNVRVCLIGGGHNTEKHEWGHNGGGGHQIEDTTNQAVLSEYPYAYAFALQGQFKTAVGTGAFCKGCPFIPAYSTPKVVYNDIRIGVENKIDNARRIRIGVEKRGAVLMCNGDSIGNGGPKLKFGGLEGGAGVENRQVQLEPDRR